MPGEFVHGLQATWVLLYQEQMDKWLFDTCIFLGKKTKCQTCSNHRTNLQPFHCFNTMDVAESVGASGIGALHFAALVGTNPSSRYGGVFEHVQVYKDKALTATGRPGRL